MAHDIEPNMLQLLVSIDTNINAALNLSKLIEMLGTAVIFIHYKLEI